MNPLATRYAGLDGRRALITGAARGIGRATLQYFLRQGISVAALDSDRDTLLQTCGEFSPEGAVVPVVADVSDRNAMELAFFRSCESLGGLDIVFANAGISIRREFIVTPPADWSRVIDVNLNGVFHTAQLAARCLTAGGAILLMASTNGMRGHKYYASYNAAKAGIISLARTMAIELAPSIRVNAICPGYVLTPMQQAEYSEEAIARLNAEIPLGRHASPEEIAALAAFLASDDARYITGQHIAIDGGETA